MFSKRRVILAVVGATVLVLGYFVWTLLPTTIRVRGNDPRILIGSVYVGPGDQLMGQVAINDGCIYMIRVNPLTHCDTIYAINQCQGQTCRLAVNQNNYTDFGDSGGPIYWGNGIYGISKGYAAFLPQFWRNRDTWSALINTNIAIGETADLSSP